MRWGRRTPPWFGLILIVVAGLLAACGSPDPKSVAQATIAVSSSMQPSTLSGAPATATSTPSTTNSSTDCPLPQSGFDCDFQQRIAAVEAYIATRPGTVGIVLRDRQTGAVWRNSYANTLVWTASTIKLAMTIDLFQRDRTGSITLSSGDRQLIQQMLHSSDDNAADALWFKYAGSDHMTFNNDFPAFGMTSLQPERGYTKFYPYWGFQKCTPNDLDRLINYMLTAVPTSERDYIVQQLSAVAPDQQWGVWGAGSAAQPGNKDGWSLEDTGWVMNTVGFVGPNQRYTLAIMNSLNGHGGYDDGQTTDSHIAQLLFAGRF